MCHIVHLFVSASSPAAGLILCDSSLIKTGSKEEVIIPSFSKQEARSFYEFYGFCNVICQQGPFLSTQLSTNNICN
jgi:hypothetical protein